MILRIHRLLRELLEPKSIELARHIPFVFIVTHAFHRESELGVARDLCAVGERDVGDAHSHETDEA